MTRRFEPGDTALLRDVRRHEIRTARPVRVVRDDDVVALFLKTGTRCMWPQFLDRTNALAELAANAAPVSEIEWQWNNVLFLMREGEPFSAELFIPADERPRSWYINMQEPFRRTGLGYDTCDHFLDVIAPLDLSGHVMKDEHELDDAVRYGFLTQDECDDVRRAADTIRGAIATGEAWWKSWNDWAPDPSWTVPSLPDDWDALEPDLRR